MRVCIKIREQWFVSLNFRIHSQVYVSQFYLIVLYAMMNFKLSTCRIRSVHGLIDWTVDLQHGLDRRTSQDRTSLNGPIGLGFYNGPIFLACWTLLNNAYFKQ